MNRHIVVYDFESDGVNPNECNAVELACVVIDPFTLEVIPNSEFCSDIRPDNFDDKDYLSDERLDTIKWHCKIKNCTQEQLLAKWDESPRLDVTWNLFVQHVNKYNKTNQQYDAPISAGMNIRNFDNIIADRFNKKFGITKLFNHEVIDIRDLAFYWLCWDNTLKSRSMDSLRKYFGISGENAHSAMKDVNDSAQIICRFLKYHKALFTKDKFKNSMKEDKCTV